MTVNVDAPWRVWNGEGPINSGREGRGVLGREEEFVAFAHAHGAGLLRIARGLLRDTGRAEDVVQSALEQVYVRWPRLTDPLSYARRSVVNGCRDSWRVRRRRPVAVSLDSAGPDTALATGARTAHVDDRAALVAALRQLPTRQREVVVLRHLVGISELETAAALGIAVGTVKAHGSRGLARLAAGLRETYPERSMRRAP